MGIGTSFVGARSFSSSRFLFLFLLIGILTACSSNSGSDLPPSAPDNTPPTASFSPPSDQIDVLVGSPISIQFSEPVTKLVGKLDASDFVICEASNCGQNIIDFDFTLDGANNLVTLQPKIALGVDKGYEVKANIYGTITDTSPAKNPLGAVSSRFYTTKPPSVTSTSPTGNTPVSTLITVAFSEAMNGDTLTLNSGITVDNGVTGTTTYDAANFTATFTPASPLVFGTTYTVTVATNAQDLASNALAQEYSWSFVAGMAPVLNLGFDIKQFKFSWAAIAGANHYRLYENPDGVSGFTKVGANIPATDTNKTLDIAVHRRAGAVYMLEACDNTGTSCFASNQVNVSPGILQAIGYFKASNTGVDDRFGISVALSGDGNTLAVGAFAEDSAATGIDNNQADNTALNAGAVYVFTRSNNNTWSQQAYVKASNTGAADLFGYSVALSGDGNTLAVGAIYESSAARGIGGNQADNTAARAGAVYVFNRSNTTWTQQAYIKASNTGAYDQFGITVALSGDGLTLAVGAYVERSAAIGIDGNQADNTASAAGAVYVFTRSNTTWTQQAYVKASNTGAVDYFGASVALSGDGSTLAVGASAEDGAATGIGGNQADNTLSGAGAVYVFTRSNTTWSQQAYVKTSNTGVGDSLGVSVVLSRDGNTLAVGASGEGSAATGIGGNQADNTASAAGAVYVFTRSNTTWSQQTYIKASNTGAYDYFGRLVALSGDGLTLAVGAYLEGSVATGIGGDQADNTASGAGAVYVFTRSTTTWSQQAYVKASNTEASDYFGGSVALSGDGNTLAVGAYFERSAATGIGGNQADKSALYAGAVYLY